MIGMKRKESPSVAGHPKSPREQSRDDGRLLVSTHLIAYLLVLRRLHIYC